jgi:hypothetical protein
MRPSAVGINHNPVEGKGHGGLHEERRAAAEFCWRGRSRVGRISLGLTAGYPFFDVTRESHV